MKIIELEKVRLLFKTKVSIFFNKQFKYLSMKFLFKKLIILGIFVASNSYGNDKQEASIIIKNATIITMTDKDVIENGSVVIKDDKIIDVGSDDIVNNYVAPVVIDAENNIVMPGMVNAHTHVPMLAFRGLGENGIHNRLFGYFIPLEKKFVTPEMVYTSTVHGAIELVQGGVTTYADMYYFMDEEAKAIKAVGVRGVLGETIIQNPSPDAENESEAIDITLALAEKYKNDDMVIPAFAPHTTYTVTEESLMKISKLSQEKNIPVLIHLAEIPNKENRGLDKDNVEYLRKVGLLNDKTNIAHAIHLEEQDLLDIKDSGAGVSYNPEANAKGATGIADAYTMLKLGIPLGIGTDGPMSANQISILPYLNYAANMQRLKYSDRTIMLPKDVVYMATLGGAKSLHIDDMVGSIEKGKKADVIMINTKSANMIPHHDIYASIVFQANPSDVYNSIIDGKLVMYNRNILTYDSDKDYKNMEILSKKVYEYGQELAKEAK